MSRVIRTLFPSSSHQPSSPQIANTTVGEIVSTASPTTNISLIHDYRKGSSSSPETTISQKASSSAQALLESLLSNTTSTNTTRALPLSVQGQEEQIAESSYSHVLSSNTSSTTSLSLSAVSGRSGNGTLDASGGNVTTTFLPVPDTTTLSPIHSSLPSPSAFQLSSSPSHITNSTSGHIHNMSAYPVPPPPPIRDGGDGRGTSHFDWLNDIDISFADVTSFLASTGMIFGAVLPYVPQYLEIKKTKNSSGFSTYVCLTLITANVLRIIFWFGKRFEIPLLIQSIVMIAAMFIMMEICLRMRNRRTSQTSSSSKTRTFLEMNDKNDAKSTTTAENNNTKNKKKKKENSPNVVVVTVDQNDNGDSRTSNPGSGDPEGGKKSRKEKMNEENNKESRVDDVGDNQKDSSNAQDCRKAKTKKEEEQNADNNQVGNHSSQKDDENDEEILVDNEHQRLTKKISKRNSKEVVVVMTDGDCHPVTEVIPDGDHAPLSPLSLRSIGSQGEEHHLSSRTTTTNPCIKVLKTISHRT